MTATTKPPAKLSREAKAWWSKIVSDFEIEDQHGLWLLTLACEAFDSMRAAEALVAEHGLLIPHGGSRKLNPAAGIAKDHRAHLLQCLKQLNLYVEPPGKAGRPTTTR